MSAKCQKRTLGLKTRDILECDKGGSDDWTRSQFHIAYWDYLPCDAVSSGAA
jgi:hypothetical protein